MTRHLLILLLSLGLSGPALAQATGDGGQARMAELRAALAPGKQVFIARQMALTPAEEADFWPIYDEHQKGLADLTERRRDNVAGPGPRRHRLHRGRGRRRGPGPRRAWPSNSTRPGCSSAPRAA